MSELYILRNEYAAAEQRAQQLMAARDEALRELHEQHDADLRRATDDAARVQKELCNAEAAHALADRQDLGDDDKTRLADSLGLTLP